VLKSIINAWRKFANNHKGAAQFIVFFILSNGITVLQMALMPIFKAFFVKTSLIDINFQFFHIGNNLNGSNYYVFDYAAGALDKGGGGGLAYFLAVEITLAIAQIINFFAQRKITFKANNSALWSAMWYIIAYVGITFIAAAAQGLYKTPIYDLFMSTWAMGKTGETIADVITMVINSAISFWVFFPIFKVIFKNNEVTEEIIG
jgi:putative flippase GtrA